MITHVNGRTRLSEEQKRKISDPKYGRKLSEEHRRKIGDGNRGKFVSEETGRKISDAKMGHPVSEETRRKMSENHQYRGKHLSADHRQRIGEAMKGRPRVPLTEEHKRKLSEANLGHTLSEEHRRKISEANLGRKVSEETRRKLSEANLGKKLSEETPPILGLPGAALGAKWDMPMKKILGIDGIVAKALEERDAAQQAADDFDLLGYCIAAISPAMKKLVVHALAEAYENKPGAVYVAYQTTVRSIAQKAKTDEALLAAVREQSKATPADTGVAL